MLSTPTSTIAPLQLQLSDPQIRLAVYALDSALESSGVFLDVDTSDLDQEIAYIESISPAARYQYALNLLQQQR